MAFPGNFKFTFDFRLEQLKKDVVHVLNKYPQGVRKQDIWPIVQKETGREINSRVYGVNKMNRVFEKWTDEITTTGKPEVCLILKKYIRNKPKEPSETKPVVATLLTELQRRKPKVEAPTPSSSSSGESKQQESEQDKETVEIDTESDCKLVDTEQTDVVDDFDFLLQKLPVIKSWILEFLTSSHLGSCRFSKLREFLKHKLREKYKVQSLKQDSLKRLLNEQFQDIVRMEQTEKSLSVYLHKATVEYQTNKGSTNSQQLTAMSLMTQMSQPKTPALQKGSSIEKLRNTSKSSAPNFISLSSDEDSDKTSNVIDLTDDREVKKPTAQPLGSLQFGAPASTSKNNMPLMSKFGAFTVPSRVLKPPGTDVHPTNLGATDSRPQHAIEIKEGYSLGQNRSDPTLPGFRDHVIDLTVEPINKACFQRKQIDVRQVFVPRGTVPPRDHVDTVTKECVAMLADANENVSMERVEKLLCQRFNCYNIRQLGFQYTDQIPCINELNRLLCKINLYIVVFVKTRCVCTVYELKEALKEYAPGKDGFDSLKLGPLQRFPVVYQHFRFPPDLAEIPNITTTDILDHFHNYLTKYNLWNKKLELDHFMAYLVDEYKADNAHQLGVKVRSLPLTAAVLKKAQRDSSIHHRQVIQHFKEELKNEIGDAFRKFRACILQTSGEGMEVREHYLKTRPDLAIMEIFDKFSVLLMITQVGERTTTKAARLRRLVEEFLSAVKDDELCRNILHLAICMTNTAVEETAMKLLTPQIVIDSDDESEQKQALLKPPPRRDALIESLKTYLERCLNAGAIGLTHLDRVEERMLEDFGFKAFNMMGYGRFIEFLLKEMKQLLEDGGGLSLGQGAGVSDTDSFKPHHTDILEFIKQCRQCGLTQPVQIEEALCKQYCVKEARHLGYGNITHLLSYADKHSRHTYRELAVVYESTLSTPKGFHTSLGSKVGILGHQTREAAKVCLHNCPLLENLADWSQWSLVFEPELGKLKDFVQKYGGVTTKTLEGGKLATIDFLALEVKPGEYLKLVSTTSAENVVSGLENRDAQSTAGHLVSMAVAYKGVASMPLALLSGHIKTALLMMHAEETTTDMEGQGTTNQHKAAMFVLQCLLHTPTKVCVSLANQIFLEPLGQVMGSSRSKQLLIQLCQPGLEQNRLVQLGCLLGIPEWTEVIQQKCKLPESAIQILPPDAKDLFGEVTQEQEEEDDIEMYDEDAEDVDEILGDRLGTGGAGGKESVEKAGGNTALEADTGKVEDSPVANKMDVTDKQPLTEPCEDIVSEIRRDEFGVGVQLSEDGQRLMKVQQERLGRSLDRLSKDLYSKDTHFVLELVQNADDNSYRDNLLNNTSKDCPSVRFVIEEDGIYVYNNELGFREKDIRALCDVGRSTKGKHKFGYIGQKGIGFKSVFRITDAPEVHSNGYHIKFDVSSGPMGYILPHWVPEADRISQEGWMTNIILRLKPDMRAQTRTLAARFNDIHPSLLLFLHRLRQIEIENKLEKCVQTMRRRDVGDSVVEIRHSHGCDRWLIVKKALDARKISLQVKSGADVESTEIALAFPLQQNGQKISLQVMPPKQPVFAFLPLRSYGFRFIIQGDFDVPSSREDVDRDSPWNQWLRNEIHHLFIDALDVFKTHQEFSSMEAVCTFLQFVPMEDEVLDFFKPVAADILKKLKANPCIPTQPNSQGVISWKIPSQTVRVRDHLVQSVITPDLLQTHLNLYYLHTDMAAMLNPTLTSCLGIETLTSDHLLQLGKALIVSMGNHCTTEEDISLIAKWMACLYRSLDEIHQEESILTVLKEQQVLPLWDRSLVSVQDRSVFYPIEDLNSKKEPSNSDTIYYIQQDVNSLHPSLLNTDDDEVNSQVHKLLSRLGVKQLSPFDVINHHIVPVMKSDIWQTKSEEVLRAYIVYIKEQTEKSPSVCNLEEVKDVTMVKTSVGFKNPSQEPVHFPPIYGNKVNLEETFPGHSWTLLDDGYLPENCTAAGRQSWMDFFKKVGVEEFLSIRQRNVQLTRENLASSLWGALSSQLPEVVEEIVIQDYHSAELEGLILNNLGECKVSYAQQMKHLCEYLDANWANFAKYTKTHVSDKDGKMLKETDTSFSVILKTSDWLPATHVGTSQNVDCVPTSESKIIMKEPSVLYLDTENVRSLLSDKVLYLNVDCTNKDFCKFLGLQNSVSIETVKEYMLKWGERTQDGKPAVFSTSLQHMKNVYVYLEKELKRKEFKDLLREKPVYFVPDRCASHILDKSQSVSGKMLSKAEIWLSDRTGLFDKHQEILEAYRSDLCGKRTIEGFYNDRKDLIELFKQEGELDTQPTVEEYLELLHALCSTYTLKDAKILSDVLYIYSTIGQALVTLSDKITDEQMRNVSLETLKSTIKMKLQKKKVLPTVKKIWVSLDDVPLINDNKDLEKMFRDKPGVHILDMEDQASKIFKTKKAKSKGRKQKAPNVLESRIQTDLIDEVIEMSGVQKLSEVIDIKTTPDMIEPCRELQLYFSRITPSLQQYLVARYGDVYHELEPIQIKQMLRDAKFFQAGKLEVSYWLTTIENRFVVQQEPCRINLPEFYLQKEYLTSMSEINKEVARYFSCRDSDCMTALRSFLSELSNAVSGVTMETVDEVLQRYEVDVVDIPEDEKWEVEPPVIDIPQQPSPEPEPTPLPISEPGIEPQQEEIEPIELPIWPYQPSNRGKTKDKKVEDTAKLGNASKEYFKSVRALPENIRMIKEDIEAEGENASDTGRETTSQEDLDQVEGQSESGADKTPTRKRKMPVKEEEGGIKRQLRDEPGQRSNEDLVKEEPLERLGGSRDDPVWSNKVTEYVFDELGAGSDLQAARIKGLVEGAADLEIGRWGEQLVSQYLSKQKEIGNIIDFKWSNDEEEAGQPFDFEVLVKDANGIHKDFIEVKSTRSNDKEIFQISVQQIKFADEKKNRFHIYRIFSAGDREEVRLIRITDLDTRLSTKQVKLCMLI